MRYHLTMSASDRIIGLKDAGAVIQNPDLPVPGDEQLVPALPPSGLDWDDFSLFKDVAAAGSFRCAARRRGIAVNTVRNRMARLERRLDVILFRRARNGLTLSGEGTRLLEVALEMQTLTALVARPGQGDALVRPGELRLSASEGIGEFWLTPRLPRLMARLPGLAITLHNDFDQQRIHDESHDLAISFLRPVDPDMIVSRLATLHFILYASERYLAEFGVPRTFEDAGRHRLVIQDAKGHQGDAIRLFLGEAAASRISIIRVNTSYSLYWAVANGVGIGALPTYVRAISRAVRPLDLPFQLRFDLWMSYHRSARRSPAVRAAVDWLRDAFDPRVCPWFAEQFIHPRDFERRIEDAAVYSLFPLGEQPQ